MLCGRIKLHPEVRKNFVKPRLNLRNEPNADITYNTDSESDKLWQMLSDSYKMNSSPRVRAFYPPVSVEGYPNRTTKPSSHRKRDPISNECNTMHASRKSPVSNQTARQ